MVKTAQKSDLPWSAIFSVIIYTEKSTTFWSSKVLRLSCSENLYQLLLRRSTAVADRPETRGEICAWKMILIVPLTSFTKSMDSPICQHPNWCWQIGLHIGYVYRVHAHTVPYQMKKIWYFAKYSHECLAPNMFCHGKPCMVIAWLAETFPKPEPLLFQKDYPLGKGRFASSRCHVKGVDIKGKLWSKNKLNSIESGWKMQKISHHWPQCAKWFSRYPIPKSGIWAKWMSPFCRFSVSFSRKYDVTDASGKTMKKWECNISAVFSSICLKFCRLLELSKEISLDFKFRC